MKQTSHTQQSMQWHSHLPCAVWVWENVLVLWLQKILRDRLCACVEWQRMSVREWEQAESAAGEWVCVCGYVCAAMTVSRVIFNAWKRKRVPACKFACVISFHHEHRKLQTAIRLQDYYQTPSTKPYTRIKTHTRLETSRNSAISVHDSLTSKTCL